MVSRKWGGEIYCADNVCINAESMLVASADIIIGKNSTLAYRTLHTTNANPNAPYNKLCKYASTFPHCSMKSREYLWPKTKRLVKDERRSKSKLRVCA